MSLQLSKSEWEDQVTQILKNDPHFSKINSTQSDPHPEAENSIMITGNIEKYNSLYQKLPESKHTIVYTKSIFEDDTINTESAKLLLQRGEFPYFEFTEEDKQVINLTLKDPPLNSYSENHNFENNTKLHINNIHTSNLSEYFKRFNKFPVVVHNIIEENNLWSIQYMKTNNSKIETSRLMHLINDHLRPTCPLCNNNSLHSVALKTVYNRSLQNSTPKNVFSCTICQSAFLQKEQPLHYLNKSDPIQQIREDYNQLLNESLEQEQELPRLPYKLFGTTEEITMFENPHKESDKYGNISYWIYLDKKLPVIYYDLEEKFFDNPNYTTKGILCDICDSEHTKKYAIKGANYSPQYGHCDTTVILCSECHKNIISQAKEILNSRDDFYEILANLL